MIIPNIFVPSDPSDKGRITALSDSIRRWSLFGKVCLTIDGSLTETVVSDLETVIKRLGGSVDLQIQADPISEDDALKLLNVGAAKIVCSPSFASGVQILSLIHISEPTRPY